MKKLMAIAFATVPSNKSSMKDFRLNEVNHG